MAYGPAVPRFDVTCDCEDGAHAGAGREHAEMAAAMIMGVDNLFNRVGARISPRFKPWPRS
jgi:citrate lyase subunit beta/citryl-CoA lyase